MVDIAHRKTSIEDLEEYYELTEVGEEYVIYTGNARNSDKYILQITRLEDEVVHLRRVLNPDLKDWKLESQRDSFPIIPITDLTQDELKEVTLDQYYNKVKDSSTFKGCKTISREAIEQQYVKYSKGLDAATAHNKTKQKESKTMNIKTQLTDNNVQAAKVAAQLTAGNVLNKTIMAKLKPQLPFMVKAYADHALANVVVANIASFAVQNFAGDNRKACWATDAMMVAAMTDFMTSFNIEDIVNEVLAGVSVPDEVED